jgi:hypothetical protein
MMAVGRLQMLKMREDANAWRAGAAGLLLAGVLVGVAIIAGAPLSRVLNPLGAVLWLASGVLLARSLPAAQRPPAGWVAAVASGVVLGAFIRPSALFEAAGWFALAGATVVVAAGDRSGVWALLAPAIYLPVHLAIGIGRAVMRGGGMRTDPPPTAAIVPLAMLVAAAAAGAAMAWFMRQRGWRPG